MALFIDVEVDPAGGRRTRRSPPSSPRSARSTSSPSTPAERSRSSRPTSTSASSAGSASTPRPPAPSPSASSTTTAPPSELSWAQVAAWRSRRQRLDARAPREALLGVVSRALRAARAGDVVRGADAVGAGRGARARRGRARAVGGAHARQDVGDARDAAPAARRRDRPVDLGARHAHGAPFPQPRAPEGVRLHARGGAGARGGDRVGARRARADARRARRGGRRRAPARELGLDAQARRGGGGAGVRAQRGPEGALHAAGVDALGPGGRGGGDHAPLPALGRPGHARGPRALVGRVAARGRADAARDRGRARRGRGGGRADVDARGRRRGRASRARRRAGSGCCRASTST